MITSKLIYHDIRVFVRADFNVPLEKGVITDDTRIRGAIPTIKYLTSKGAKVILSSHLGRPKGGFEAKFSLAPITPRLAELLGQPVALVSDCIGEPVATAVAGMANGDVVLLENVRFYPEEEKNDKAFAEKLAANADVFVNDAFGTAHRYAPYHASRSIRHNSNYPYSYTSCYAYNNPLALHSLIQCTYIKLPHLILSITELTAPLRVSPHSSSHLWPDSFCRRSWTTSKVYKSQIQNTEYRR